MNNWYSDPDKYRAFRDYWIAYGGLNELSKSPYLGLSILLTGILFPIWWHPNEDGAYEWCQLSFSILPAMIGFSLGAIAILISFGDRAFDGTIHKKRGAASYFIQLAASFFHFIIVQIIGLMTSFLLMAFPIKLFSAVAFFFLMYAILSGLAAVASLFGAAQILDVARRLEAEKKSASDEGSKGK